MMNIRLFILSITSFLAAGIYGQHSETHWTEDPTLICPEGKSAFYTNYITSIVNPNPLMANYDVKFYKLDIKVNDSVAELQGYAVVAAEVVEGPLDTFSIELHNKLSADSVYIDGIKYPFSHESNNIYVSPDPPIEPGTLFEFKLFYHTPEGYSSGYFSSTQHPNYGDFHVTQTFSEPYSAHEWMPCKQELTDKADSVHIFITTDTSLTASGPGLLTQVALPDGEVRHEWRCHIPTAYYLISFAVSDYQAYDIYAKPENLPDDSILIQNLVYDYPGCLESNKTNIDNTSSMLELLSELYGLYPFHEEKYGHYMWYPPGFSGMEHITMSGMRYLNTYLISHELGHSWFGNNVTCATWSDIWVNEGFATYTQYLVLEYLFSKSSADAQMNSYMNYVMSIPGGSVYVPADDLFSAGRIFSTRLSYRKGGALVHMIRYMMQDDSLFFKTLHDFQEEFRDSLATGMDFKSVCENVSGIDFTDFFNEWYFGEGFPIYTLTWSQYGDSLALEVEQSTSTDITPIFHIPMEYRVYWEGGDSTFRFDQVSNDTTYSVILPHEVTGIVIDPANWVLNGVDAIIHRKNLDIKVYLEGPFQEGASKMICGLGEGNLPLNQPYGVPPWNYPGQETMASVPEATVDWVLLELHDTNEAGLVSSGSLVDRQAALLDEHGRILQPDGLSAPYFDAEPVHGLFVRILHRNHLSVLSSQPIGYDMGAYIHDFTTGDAMAAGGAGIRELMPGIWGMAAGDVNADGSVNPEDKVSAWEPEAGEKGYLSGDLNLDGECNNIDKNDLWRHNNGMNAYEPD
jgi:hypothetical protein